MSPSLSLIPAQLIAVYEQSNYLVFSDPQCCLTIGQTSAELLALYQKHKVAGAVFISACNPRSECQSDSENARLNLALETELRALSSPFYPAEGRDPKGIWPSESSFLVMGLALDVGAQLGRQYGQNAILCCSKDSLVELVLLR